MDVQIFPVSPPDLPVFGSSIHGIKNFLHKQFLGGNSSQNIQEFRGKYREIKKRYRHVGEGNSLLVRFKSYMK
jgi:hypothetical protein